LRTNPAVKRNFLALSLHTRLVLSHVLVTLISVVLVAIFAREAIYRAAREDAEHLMEDIAFAASKALEDPMKRYLNGVSSLDDLQQAATRLLGDEHNIGYALYLSDGSLVLDSDPDAPVPGAGLSPEVFIALESEHGEADLIRPNDQGLDFIHVAFVVGHAEEIYGVLDLRTPLQPVLNPARRNFLWLLFVALLVILGVGAVGGLLAQSLAAPVERLTIAADHLSQGDLETRVRPEGAPEMRRLTTVFNAMADQLQSTLQELRVFVANASHELRTPLTTVRLRVEALRAGALQDPLVAQRFLADIEEQVDRMSRLVNDLLDLSRLESGIDSGEREPLDLGNIASAVRDVFRVRAEESNIHLNWDVEGDLPKVAGDEDQMWRVISNLLDNAISFTPAGGRVDLRVKSLAEGRIVRLEIQDTGMGILERDLPHIFERFYRTENTRQRKSRSQGSGLGLAISKSIVEKHGGRIGVTSRLGAGSLFWVEMPTN
jgi:signal transduction histidine kinase